MEALLGLLGLAFVAAPFVGLFTALASKRRIEELAHKLSGLEVQFDLLQSRLNELIKPEPAARQALFSPGPEAVEQRVPESLPARATEAADRQVTHSGEPPPVAEPVPEAVPADHAAQQPGRELPSAEAPPVPVYDAAQQPGNEPSVSTALPVSIDDAPRQQPAESSPPKPAFDLEALLGVRGAAWVGAIALVIAGTLFAKYSIPAFRLKLSRLMVPAPYPTVSPLRWLT